MTASGPVVLVIEDDPAVRRFLRASLAVQGYRLLEAVNATEGARLAASHNPELVLLDLGLPDADGIDLTRTLRESSGVPIIVISARGREDDKVAALDAGADDYLTKPFGVNELLARMRVALRHAQAPPAASTLECGDLKIDLVRRQVRVAEREVHLTPIEYRLLALLARNAGRVLTHRQILNEIWGPHHVGQAHYVRVHMAELRKKVEADPARPRLIVTELGVGYRLRDREG
jgi:two-component system, OmpR family, KDP operon response regulator KdpE